MKTLSAKLFALCIFTLMLALPRASHAQVGMALNSYFGYGNAKLAFCQARTLVTASSIQGAINYAAPTGSITIEVTTLVTKEVISAPMITNYALVTGWGYWTPTGSTETIPCLVKAEFTQNNANMATLAVQLTNYATGKLVYSSGTLEKAGANVIAIGVTTTPIITPPANNVTTQPGKTTTGTHKATAATAATAAK